MNALTQVPPGADLEHTQHSPDSPSPDHLSTLPIPPSRKPARWGGRWGGRTGVLLLVGVAASLLLGLLALPTVTARLRSGPGLAGPGMAGPSVAGGLVVEGAWARAATRPTDGSGGTSAVYMQLRNPGGELDRLLGATSDVATMTEVHRTTVEDGVMRMRPAGPIDVPAGETVTLQPGGLHVMLIDLRHDLVAGERLAVTLQFERAGELTVEAEIRAPMQGPMQAPMHGR